MEDQYWVHELDPIMLSVGPIDVRWYAMAYIIGLLVGWRLAMRLANRSPLAITPDHLDRFLTWAVVGVIVGGRLGAFLFYRPEVFFQEPLQVLRVWEGGMSFHGGLLGVMVAMLLFARLNKIALLSLTDIVCAVAPFGIMLGRIANFINGEHWGRVADVSWAVIFPRIDLLPRHPSQLYESVLEGLLLFVVTMLVVYRGKGLSRPGLLSGVFLVGYALARMTGEIFREPEILAQTLPFGTTWGQWLSLPMLLGGIYLIQMAVRRDRVTA